MEDETTKNPYDFVPFPDGAAIERQPPSGHDTFSGISGRFECELEALSPLLVMGPDRRAGTNYRNAGRFQEGKYEGPYKDRRLRALIPGASLKGVVRSVFNVLMPSCIVSTSTEKLVPEHFLKCTRHEELCPACRVFGALSQDRVHRGHVNIGEAVAVGGAPMAKEVQLVPLFNPQPFESNRYGTVSNPAGRKFYFHHHELSTAETQNDRERGRYVAPVKGRTEDDDIGATFEFEVSFQNLSERQLAALVSALTLTGDAPLGDERVAVRHKVGYGKPAGLGSAEIRVTRAVLEQEPQRRYQSFRARPDVFEADTDELADWLDEQRAPFFASPTPEVQNLIRILRYPPDPGVTYEYPEWQG